ncbi:hypothetical protein [Georgenia faecalis]|uniref:hypothetical protein n=1 Tax=Georgenia faecalis TaxID=2483799 RepID=UPI000FDA2036|nr:hypothetical protein [Georgenia faecalis]
MTTGTDRSAVHGRSRLKSAIAGAAIALLAVPLTNELSRNWVYFPANQAYGESYLIAIAVFTAVAALLGSRYPRVGLWAGGASTCLVALGLAIGAPQDAVVPTLPGILGLIARFGHDLAVVVATGAVLAAAAGSLLRMRVSSRRLSADKE